MVSVATLLSTGATLLAVSRVSAASEGSFERKPPEGEFDLDATLSSGWDYPRVVGGAAYLQHASRAFIPTTLTAWELYEFCTGAVLDAVEEEYSARITRRNMRERELNLPQTKKLRPDASNIFDLCRGAFVAGLSYLRDRHEKATKEEFERFEKKLLDKSSVDWGVWQREPTFAEVAVANPDLRQDFIRPAFTLKQLKAVVALQAANAVQTAGKMEIYFAEELRAKLKFIDELGNPSFRHEMDGFGLECIVNPSADQFRRLCASVVFDAVKKELNANVKEEVWKQLRGQYEAKMKRDRPKATLEGVYEDCMGAFFYAAQAVSHPDNGFQEPFIEEKMLELSALRGDIWLQSDFRKAFIFGKSYDTAEVHNPTSAIVNEALQGRSPEKMKAIVAIQGARDAAARRDPLYYGEMLGKFYFIDQKPFPGHDKGYQISDYLPGKEYSEPCHGYEETPEEFVPK